MDGENLSLEKDTLNKTELKWDQDLVLPLTIAIMASSFMAILLSLFRLLFPSVYVLPFYPLLFLLISAEGVLTTKLLFPVPEERMGFRVREWVIILIALRVVFYFEGGISWNEVIDSLRGLGRFLPRPFLINSVAFLISWWLASLYTKDLLRIQMIPHKNLPPSDNKLYSEWVANVAKYFNHRSIFRSISNKFVSGCIIMVVVLSFLWHIKIRHLESYPKEYTYMLMAGFVYFTSGLILINGVYYLKLRIDWMKERIPSSPQVSPNWVKASLVTILIICGLGLLLPTNYSPFSWDRFLLTIVNGIERLAGFLSNLFTFSPSDPEPLQIPPLPPPQSGFSDFGEPSLFEIVLAILYILMLVLPIMIVFVGLVVGLVYILQSGEMPEGRTRDKLIWILRQYKVLLGQAAGATLRWIGNFNPFRIFFRKSESPESDAPAQGVRLDKTRKHRRSAARQKALVTEMYLSFIQLAMACGCSRRPSDTPHEYSRRVLQELSVDEEGVGYLTDSFVRKRYGVRPLSKEEIGQAKSWWKKVRAELKGLKMKEARLKTDKGWR